MLARQGIDLMKLGLLCAELEFHAKIPFHGMGNSLLIDKAAMVHTDGEVEVIWTTYLTVHGAFSSTGICIRHNVSAMLPFESFSDPNDNYDQFSAKLIPRGNK